MLSFDCTGATQVIDEIEFVPKLGAPLQSFRGQMSRHSFKRKKAKQLTEAY